jgi:hypothetical protein
MTPMNRLKTVTLLAIGLSLANLAAAEQTPSGLPYSFLDWDLSAVRIGTPSPAMDQDHAVNPGLSRKLAEMKAGEPALEDIGILEEEPMTPDLEALSDLEYIASFNPPPVK